MKKRTFLYLSLLVSLGCSVTNVDAMEETEVSQDVIIVESVQNSSEEVPFSNQSAEEEETTAVSEESSLPKTKESQTVRDVPVKPAAQPRTKAASKQTVATPKVRAVVPKAASASASVPQGPYISDGSYVQITKKDYTIWQNFNWKAKGSTNAYYGKVLLAKGRYEHSNGSVYYSLYDNKDQWLGYLNTGGTTKTNVQGPYIADGRKVKVTSNNYSLYSNFNWKVKTTSRQLYGQTLTAKGRYEHFNGSSYYSLFDSKDQWQGYVNTNAVSNVVVSNKPQGNYIADGRYVTISKKNYSLYQNFNWKTKGNTTNMHGQTYEARGRYEHSNGATYYSLYDQHGIWRGYLNASATSAGRQPKATHILSSRDEQLAQEEMHRLVNQERRKHGLQPLVQRDYLTESASIRAYETEVYFSHTRPDGYKWYRVINEVKPNFDLWSVGENIASNTYSYTDGKDIANRLFNQWMKSPGHRDNMLTSGFNTVGYGFYESNGEIFGAQIFSKEG